MNHPSEPDPWKESPRWGWFSMGVMVGFLAAFYWLVIKVGNAGSGHW